MKEIPFDKLIKNRKDVYIFSAAEGKPIKATLVSLDFDVEVASFSANGKSYSCVPFSDYGFGWSLDLNDLRPKKGKKIEITRWSLTANVYGNNIEISKDNKLLFRTRWTQKPTIEDIETYLRFLDNGYRKA